MHDRNNAFGKPQFTSEKPTMPSGNQDLSMKDLTGPIERFTVWLANFNAQAAAIANAAANIGVGVAGPPATGMLGVVAAAAAWVSAVGLAQNPPTRTPVTIAAMHAIRRQVVDGGPAFSSIRSAIRACQGGSPNVLTAGQLTQLGLTNHLHIRSPAPVPVEGPIIVAFAGKSHQLVLRYYDDAKDFTKKRKPRGVKGVLVTWDAANGDNGSAIFTKSPCYLNFGDSVAGQEVTIIGQWFRGNNLYSVPGPAVHAVVPRIS
jgi:hypothetical protein